MASAPDVVVVGAGAAGIAAGRRLAEAGRSVLLVEALPRLGGRARTERIAGLPLDLGCGWLHSAERNPLAALAAAEGLRGRPQPGGVGRAARRARRRRRRSAPAPGRPTRPSAARLRRDPPASDRASDAMPADDPWRPFVDALSGYMNGVGTDGLSVRDFLAYDDAASDANWRLPGGYGAFVAGLAAGLPVRARHPRHRGLGGPQGAGRDRRRAPSRRGRRSSRCRPRCSRPAPSASTPPPTAISMPRRGSPSASPTRSSSRSTSPGRCRPRATSSAASTAPGPRATTSGPSAARSSSASSAASSPASSRRRARRPRSPSSAASSARSSARASPRGLRPLAVTAWGREPTILGSYSHALPGAADARAVLAAPVSPRLAFAGEACSPHDFSTAHGAWASGVAAADFVAEALG